MEPRCNAPGAESVKEYSRGIVRFIRVKLVKEVMSRMRGIGECRQFCAQDSDLPVAEEAHAGQITSFLIEGHLIVAQPEARPLSGRGRHSDEIADWRVMSR